MSKGPWSGDIDGGIGDINEGIRLVFRGTEGVVRVHPLSLLWWMKVFEVITPGPPSCRVVLRQLCRKLMGSSG